MISVIVRTKNRPGMLREALESIANQSYRTSGNAVVEAIVCNDGGIDVKTILTEITQKTRMPITYVSVKESVGRCQIGNLGLEKAQGDWVAWLDDDDLFLPEHLETLMASVASDDSSSPKKIIYADSWRSLVTKDPTGKWLESTCDRPLPCEPFDRLRLVRGMPFHMSAMIVHRQCLKVIGYPVLDPESAPLEDYDLVIRLSQNFDFERVDKTTTIYRIRDNQSNSTTSQQQDFMATREKIYKKYAHVVLSSLAENMLHGHQQLTALQEKVSNLESQIKLLVGNTDTYNTSQSESQSSGTS